MLLHAVIFLLELLLNWISQLPTPGIPILYELCGCKSHRGAIAHNHISSFSSVLTGAREKVELVRLGFTSASEEEKLLEPQCSSPSVYLDEFHLSTILLTSPLSSEVSTPQSFEDTRRNLCRSPTNLWLARLGGRENDRLPSFSPLIRKAMPDYIIGCRGAKTLEETFWSSPDHICHSTWICFRSNPKWTKAQSNYLRDRD